MRHLICTAYPTAVLLMPEQILCAFVSSGASLTAVGKAVLVSLVVVGIVVSRRQRSIVFVDVVRRALVQGYPVVSIGLVVAQVAFIQLAIHTALVSSAVDACKERKVEIYSRNYNRLQPFEMKTTKIRSSQIGLHSLSSCSPALPRWI